MTSTESKRPWQHTEEIADLSNRIIQMLRDDPADPMIKAAALRSAAGIFDQAVQTQALLANMQKILRS